MSWGILTDWLIDWLDAVGVEQAGDVSGDDKAADILEKAHRRVLYEDEDNTTATVCVCYTNPSLSKSKILHFTLSSSVFDGGNTLQVTNISTRFIHYNMKGMTYVSAQIYIYIYN